MKDKIEFLFVLFLNIVIEDGMHRYIKSTQIISKGSSWFPPISYEPRMGSKEDAGKGCPAAGGVSSFTIQSILGGGPSEAPREPAAWPARKRSLSVSSEEEEPDDGWKAPACFCPDPHGPKEPGSKHHPPIPFPCLGKDRTPPGRPGASSRGGKLCRGSRVGPPAPGQSRGRAGSGAEGGVGGRGVLRADSSAPRVLGKKPGTQMPRGAVWGKVGLMGVYLWVWHRAGRSQGSAISPLHIGYFLHTMSGSRI